MDNMLNIYCEVVTLFTFVSTLIMNLFPLAEKIMDIYGWFLTAIVLSALVFCWVLIVPDMVKAFYKGIVKTIRKLLGTSKETTVKSIPPPTSNSNSEAKETKKPFIASKSKIYKPRMPDFGKPAKVEAFHTKPASHHSEHAIQ